MSMRKYTDQAKCGEDKLSVGRHCSLGWDPEQYLKRKKTECKHLLLCFLAVDAMRQVAQSADTVASSVVVDNNLKL